MPEQTCRWKAHFGLDPPLTCKSIQNLPEIKIITEGAAPDVKAIELEILTPDLRYEAARKYVIEKGNRCSDYLTFLKRFHVAVNLRNLNPLNPPRINGWLMLDSVELTAKVKVEKSQDIHLAVVADVLDGVNYKLGRQLSHYRRAMETDDPVNRVRELFEVVEDEYGKGHPAIEKYSWLRHFVSHPELNDPKAASLAKQQFGRAYLDPSNPNDLTELRQRAETLKTDVENILSGKL